MKNAHLDDNQFTGFVLGAPGPDAHAATHLESCEPCRVEVELVRGRISAFCESVGTAAERDELFWARQRRAIHDRLPQSAPIRMRQWALSAVAALVLLAVLLLTHTPPPERASVETTKADEALLLQVESDIERDVPLALQPAGLIAQAQSAALESSDTSELSSTTR